MEACQIWIQLLMGRSNMQKTQKYICRRSLVFTEKSYFLPRRQVGRMLNPRLDYRLSWQDKFMSFHWASKRRKGSCDQSTERLLVMHLWGDKYDISLMSVGICSIPLFTSIGYTLSITQQHINALTDPVMIVRDAVRRQDVCTDEISPVSILTLYWFCG